MKKLLFVLFLLAVQSAMFAQKPKIVTSNKEGWHKIGETTVDFKKETDEILVIGADRFNSLKIKITKAPINLTAFDIYFEDGEKQNVSIAQEIKAPGETREISLTGGERSIKKVIFTYKTVNNQDTKAVVELWGHKK